MSWEQMPLEAKAELMKVYVKSGIKSLRQMKDHYNEYGQGGSIYRKLEGAPYSQAQNQPDKVEFPYDGTSMYKGGYNLDRARELYEPDATGHLPSVDNTTGEWLKDKDYPTSWMELMRNQLDVNLNKDVGHPYQNERGKLQYPKGYNKFEDGGSLDESTEFSFMPQKYSTKVKQREQVKPQQINVLDPTIHKNDAVQSYVPREVIRPINAEHLYTSIGGRRVLKSSLNQNNDSLQDLGGEPSTGRTLNEKAKDYWEPFGGRVQTNVEQLRDGVGKGLLKTVGASAAMAAGAAYSTPAVGTWTALGKNLIAGSVGMEGFAMLEGRAATNAELATGAAMEIGMPIVFKGASKLYGKMFNNKITTPGVENVIQKIPKENSNPYGYMRRNLNPPVDELGQKLKFSVPSKIKNSETYRAMTTADTEHLLSTGKFKTSLPIEQDVKFMEGLKTTNPERYKAIKYAENSRNYTRVTPDKNYAEMHYFDDPINSSDKGNIVTLKPLKNRIAPSTEVGGYNELFAKDLIIDDVLHIKDRSGKVIYQSPNSKKQFKSEIDWGKWNSEIPDNKPLMQEYHVIEQTAKQNGTWMKNPDGSAFQGAPEQFVQQNSRNFKQAYPSGFEETFRGGSVNPELARPYLAGNDVVFTTMDDYGAQVYNRTRNPYNVMSRREAPPRGISKLYMPETQNKLTIDGALDEYSRRNYARLNPGSHAPKNNREAEILSDFSDFMKSEFPDVDLKDNVMTDHFARFLGSKKGRNVDRIEFKKILDGTIDPIDVEVHNRNLTKQLKSMFGNNGMFDMTNPNIYKGLIPAGLMTGYLKSKTNKDEKVKR